MTVSPPSLQHSPNAPHRLAASIPLTLQREEAPEEHDLMAEIEDMRVMVAAGEAAASDLKVTLAASHRALLC